jgi:alcohol dehydrogenase
MIENFEFHNPTRIIFGKGTLPQIGPAIKARGCQRVLLLAGSGSIQKNGVYEAVCQGLKEAGVQWVELWGVRPNPVLSKVREAIELARNNQVEAILAVGGGSVLDSAKVVAAGFYLEDVWEVFERRAAIERALPLFTVLTLSATGSEMNCAAVLTNETGRKKWAVVHPGLFPVASVIDPSVQMSLPWTQTVNGGMDALAHIMEYYFLGRTEEVTIALDEALMRTVIRVVDLLQKDPTDYDSRANLAWSATLALNGISGVALKGGDWATHQIEHGLSACYPEVAHGMGLGILFPAWIQYLQSCNRPQFQRWAREVWNGDSVEAGIANMKATLTRWGAPTSLRQLGITKPELKTIAANACMVGLLGQLKPLALADVESILELAW